MPRKSVRFVENEVQPSDRELLKQSAKRRPGDQTIGVESDGYDVAPGPSMGDQTRSVKKFKSKHTLESDEEEDDQDTKLNVDSVEGQEDATIDFDDETKITPFNMKEEMEDGYYDSEGNFVFKKKEIKDAWLDNIDWVQIKKDAGNLWNQEENDDAEDEPLPVGDQLDVYTAILSFMASGETITKTLKRLNGGRNMANVRQQRWKERKNKQKEAAEQNSDSATTDTSKPDSDVNVNIKPDFERPASSYVDDNADSVIKLTELVDKLVAEGEFEVYGYTFEKIKYEVEKRENMKKFRDELATKAEVSTDDNDLDMFADNIDANSLKSLKEAPKNLSVETPSTSNEQSGTSADSVVWEFKWINESEAPVYGPCSSEQMQKWVDDGYFKDGVYVRRANQSDAQFYSSKRIDFELYM